MIAGICQCLALGSGEGRVVQIIGLLGNIRHTFGQTGSPEGSQGRQTVGWSISHVHLQPKQFC